MSDAGDAAVDQVLEVRYTLDVDALARALALPVHGWLAPRQVWGLRVAFVALSAWGIAFGVRAVYGAPPALLEGFAVGVGMYVWDAAWQHLRMRLGASAILRSLGVTGPIGLTVAGDGVRLAGVPALQRFPRRAVTHWTDGGGWLLLFVGPYVLPVDLASIPAVDADALRRWLRRAARGGVEVPERRDSEVSYVPSRAVFVATAFERTHAHPRNLRVFAVSLGVAHVVSRPDLLVAIVVGWNLALVVGLWRAAGPGEPRVLSVDPRGLVQRGADGWRTTPWTVVDGARRIPGLGWMLHTRHGDHPIGRDAEGDVEGFIERVRRRGASP